MSGAGSDVDRSKIEAILAERARWATLFVTIQEIAYDNKALVRDLASYDPTVAVPLLASLLTLPEYQSNCIRLEILVVFAVIYCGGRKKAKMTQVARWFSQIGESLCVIGEDPAEDVFVSLVQDKLGGYRLLEGVWEATGFYTQRVLDVIATMPDAGHFGQIKNSVRALLIISDIVCEKAGLRRYQLGSDESHSALSSRKIPGKNALISRVTISFSELEERGIKPTDIDPFLFQPQMRKELTGQQIGSSLLDCCPLTILADTNVTVALPTALSVATRDYVIANIIQGGLVETFNGMLAKNYGKLFFDTPLLGGPMRAPVH